MLFARTIQKIFVAMLRLPCWPYLPRTAGRPLAALVEAWMVSPHGDYHFSLLYLLNEMARYRWPARPATRRQASSIFWVPTARRRAEVNHPGTINSPIGCATCHTTRCA